LEKIAKHTPVVIPPVAMKYQDYLIDKFTISMQIENKHALLLNDEVKDLISSFENEDLALNLKPGTRSEFERS
jgi:hypothetical protein